MLSRLTLRCSDERWDRRWKAVISYLGVRIGSVHNDGQTCRAMMSRVHNCVVHIAN